PADDPIILEGTIEGYQVRRIYVDGGSSSEIMYEHCFKNFDANIRSKVKETQNTSVGSTQGDNVYHTLLASHLTSAKCRSGELGRSKTVLLEFAIVRCRSPYNVIIGRTGMESLRAVRSTIHSVIKFLTARGMELITPDLACPSTHQLLWNSISDSRPDLSFDKSASPERLFSSARVSLAELGDEGSRSEGTKLIQIFIKAEKTPSPSLTFIEENIDVLRTIIKEHDQQAKIKVTPRRLAYSNSDKEAPARSLARGFFDRFSLESSSTSDTHRQTRSASKSQRTPFKNKEPARLKRSRRLEDRSITKEKTGRKRSVET
ncbi:hypothetical protein Tco_0378274, partial [Tanacetum coccineum]